MGGYDENNSFARHERFTSLLNKDGGSILTQVSDRAISLRVTDQTLTFAEILLYNETIRYLTKLPKIKRVEYEGQQTCERLGCEKLIAFLEVLVDPDVEWTDKRLCSNGQQVETFVEEYFHPNTTKSQPDPVTREMIKEATTGTTKGIMALVAGVAVFLGVLFLVIMFIIIYIIRKKLNLRPSAVDRKEVLKPTVPIPSSPEILSPNTEVVRPMERKSLEDQLDLESTSSPESGGPRRAKKRNKRKGQAESRSPTSKDAREFRRKVSAHISNSQRKTPEKSINS